MQKQKEKIFLDKFRLLNSQEQTEEIIWSPSDSSDYEEPAEKFKNLTNKTRILKRKRKIKPSNNISNLSITVLDTSKSHKELQNGETSPILVSKIQQKSFQQSPILPSTQSCRHQTTSTDLTRSVHHRSPILAPKNHSPKTDSNIRKKLFTHQQCDYRASEGRINVKNELESQGQEDDLICGSLKEEYTSKAKSELVSKVKSFFDNHFSSESSSQSSQPISETQSQTQSNSTKTSDEVEILTCKTHTASTKNSKSIESIKIGESDHSPESTCNISKKVRYKKGGLAYRLSNLLKKQKACLSLWHHERFLAANSNFIIPKVESSVFRIQKVNFKYGCYLLEAVDLNESSYLVLINSSHVSDTIVSDTILTVYEPFKVVQFNKDTKLLINVCRFESSQYKV